MPQPLRRADRPSPGRPVTTTGVHGTLRWGYHVAATIRDWTIIRTARSSTLTGGVVSFERVRTDRRPLYFSTLIQGSARAWEWPVVRLEIDARVVRADLGPQEP